MKDMKSNEPEFSRLFYIDAGGDVTKIAIEADTDECAALAKRFGLLELQKLSAIGMLEKSPNGGGATLDVSVKADVVYACVVTLEPVTQNIDEHLIIAYLPADEFGQDKGGDVEIVIDMDDDENIEPLTGNAIDVGDAVAECLGLALDPYPRSSGADSALSELKVAGKEEDQRSPFAALGKLKGK
jgi:uncharacterized metal-binding protein YceD (DUF177 family)